MHAAPTGTCHLPVSHPGFEEQLAYITAAASPRANCATWPLEGTLKFYFVSCLSDLTLSHRHPQGPDYEATWATAHNSDLQSATHPWTGNNWDPAVATH